MRAAVITRHAVANYGSILQTYATQYTLEKNNIECSIINYVRKDEYGKNIAKTMLKRNKKWNKNILTRCIYSIIQTPSYNKSYKAFEKYRKEIIHETKTLYYSFDELKQNKPKADVFISGSDQIWGKIGDDDFDKAYFLDFLDESDRCISYATSFGKNNISPELKKKLPKLLKKYEHISVREERAKELLKESSISSIVTLDPTLLLSKDEWTEFAEDSYYKNYIVVYQLHNDNKIMDIAKAVSEKVNKKILVISANPQKTIGDFKYLYLPNPRVFLSCIKNASYIVTDSFHATVFSILFNKQFIVSPPNETSSRITNLLEKYNLSSRIFKNIEDIFFNIDYDSINKRIEQDRIKSIEFLINSILKNSNSIDKLNKSHGCSGCTACANACPFNAIKMVQNEEGFFEPKINNDKCNNCGICAKKCPQLNNNVFNKPKAYAAYMKANEDIINSSSGGIFFAIAKEFIREGNAVYGVAWDNNIRAVHIRVDNEKTLKKLQGSKYVQSNPNNTFLMVKKDLENGVKVLYSGTPCQIAGLYKFLGKKYDDLYTIDLVCHGVPSPLLFRKYLLWLQKRKKDIVTNYSFRDKKQNDWGVNARIEFKNRKDYYIRAKLDPYFKAFTDGITYRECCYNCKYAKKERISDITLADYWGIEKIHPDFKNSKGISLVLINNSKGNILLESVKNDIIFLKSSVEKASEYNLNLNSPSKRTNHRNKAYNNISLLDIKEFKKYAKNNLNYKISFKETIKQIMPYSIKKKIKKIIKK